MTTEEIIVEIQNILYTNEQCDNLMLSQNEETALKEAVKLLEDGTTNA